MKNQIVIASALFAALSTGALAQSSTTGNSSGAMSGSAMGRSAAPAQSNGDTSAPAAGGGRETTSSGTYGGTQIPGHGGN